MSPNQVCFPDNICVQSSFICKGADTDSICYTISSM